jgi:RluA family pseudouridine synthase
MNIPLVYEDDALLVADKPAGLVTIPSPRGETRTLTSILNDDARAKGATYGLHPCHRLDRETSGLIVYAKGKATQHAMMDMFKHRQVEKTYMAFVHGALPKPSGVVAAPVEGKPAQTHYRVAQRRREFSVLEVQPLTGRTNQIRIHLKSIGHPLVGETKFAFRKDFALRAKRAMLHAWKLKFAHPRSGLPVALEAPLPSDMEQFLRSHP